MHVFLDRRALLAALIPGLAPLKDRVQRVARLEDFGAKGDGTAFDSEAINLALRASARTGSTVFGTPGAIYRINPVGQKSFINPMGDTISKKYCIEVPHGAKVDFRKSILILDINEDAIVMSNANTHTTGDQVSIRNVTIDGNFGDRTTPMIWFHGTKNSKFEYINAQNCNYTAISFTSISDCKLDQISAMNIIGQAIMLGGSLSQNISKCSIGTLSAFNVRKYRDPHQPGNPALIGGNDIRISRISAQNCDAGIKISSGSSRIEIASTEFRKGQTQNSGIKIQGSPEAPCTDIQIHKAISEDCFGSGVFIRHARDCEIIVYRGNNNGIGGKDADISISGERIRLRSATSKGYLHGALYVAPGSASLQIGKLDVGQAGSDVFRTTIDIAGGSVEIENLTLPVGGYIRYGSNTSARITRFKRN